MDAATLKLANLHLLQSDKIMQQMIKQTSPLALRKTAPSYFHALIHTIINQQLSVKAAATIVKRVLNKQNGSVFNADKLNSLSIESLRECGLSQNKIRYVKTLAKAVIDKELNLRKLVNLDDEDRKSTRLNSSHLVISYAAFCLKKTKQHRKSVTQSLEIRS